MQLCHEKALKRSEHTLWTKGFFFSTTSRLQAVIVRFILIYCLIEISLALILLHKNSKQMKRCRFYTNIRHTSSVFLNACAWRGWSKPSRRLTKMETACWTSMKSTSFYTNWMSICRAGRSSKCFRWGLTDISIHRRPHQSYCFV